MLLVTAADSRKKVASVLMGFGGMPYGRELLPF